MTLTVERLRSLASYNPATGEFVWIVGRNGAAAGSPVGGRHRVKGYGEAMIDGVGYATHRLAWFCHYGTWPTGVIDHINGNRDDNRISNMRDVSVAVNNWNRTTSKHARSNGLIGAHFNKRRQKWLAMIGVNYRQFYLGTFDTEQEAHAAYLAAKHKLHQGHAA